MRLDFTTAILASLLIAVPQLHAGPCQDDPTVAPYIQALSSDSRNLDNAYNLAIAYYKVVSGGNGQNGQTSPCLGDAIDAMRHFVKMASGKNVPSGQMADAYGVIGILEFQFGGDAKSGLADFKKAIELRADDKDSNFGAAMAAMKLEKTQEANSYFKKTIQVDPGNVIAEYNYATTLDTMFGDTPSAEQSAELIRAFEGTAKAARVDPNSYKDILLVTYNGLASLYSKSGNAPKAIDNLNRAISLDPNDYNAHFQLGVMYSKEKNYVKMQEQYEKAIAIKPDDEDARYNLAVAYSEQEQFDKAYDQFAYITQHINKDDSQVLALQAQTLDEAIDELTTQGTTAYTGEDYATAKDDFEKVLSLNPGNRNAKKYLSDTNNQIETKFAEYVKEADKLAAHGKKVDAAELYDKALSLKPDSADIKAKSKKLGADIHLLVNRYISLGDAAFKRGDDFSAQENYKKAAQFKQGKLKAEERLKKIGNKFNGDFARDMRDGKRNLGNDKLAEARNAFKAALSVKAGDQQATAALLQVNGRIQDRIKKLSSQATSAEDKAKKTSLYNKILALDPANQDAAERIKSLTGKEAKAKVNADETKALYYQGVDFYVNNNIQQAIATWQKLLVLDPDNEDAKKDIARARTKLAALASLSKS